MSGAQFSVWLACFFEILDWQQPPKCSMCLSAGVRARWWSCRSQRWGGKWHEENSQPRRPRQNLGSPRRYAVMDLCRAWGEAGQERLPSHGCDEKAVAAIVVRQVVLGWIRKGGRIQTTGYKSVPVFWREAVSNVQRRVLCVVEQGRQRGEHSVWCSTACSLCVQGAGLQPQLKQLS